MKSLSLPSNNKILLTLIAILQKEHVEENDDERM